MSASSRRIFRKRHYLQCFLIPAETKIVVGYMHASIAGTVVIWSEAGFVLVQAAFV